MKLNCGHSAKARFRRKHMWHLWFAWHPVRVGPKDCRWLERVERKGRYCGLGDWFWRYRKATK